MIGIIDYGLGNLGSVRNMFRRIGAEAFISADPAALAAAPKLVLPGVGAFDHGISKLRSLALVELLERRVRAEGVPLLCLCLGMQLLARRSEEGQMCGLGWLDADCVRFNAANASMKIPHMGWNTVDFCRPSPVFHDLGDEPRFYFVHSYHLACRNADDVAGKTVYGYEFPSAIQQGHIFGLQCHPEKSHKFGMQVFRNFAAL